MSEEKNPPDHSIESSLTQNGKNYMVSEEPGIFLAPSKNEDPDPQPGDQLLDTLELRPNLIRRTSLETMLGCGFYQTFHFIVSHLITIGHSYNITMMAFGKVKPKWQCLDDQLGSGNFSTTSSNFTCADFDRLGCKNLKMETDFESVVYEYKLFCGGMRSVFLSITLQMFGLVIGYQFWGYLSDTYGRKWTLFAALLGLTSAGFASVFCPDINTFCIIRLIIGFFASGTMGITNIYLNEFVVSKHRWWIACLNAFTVPHIYIAVMAWLVPNWKQLTIIFNSVAAIALFLLCFFNDSPSWLMQHGQENRAKISVVRVQKLNSMGPRRKTTSVNSPGEIEVTLASMVPKSKSSSSTNNPEILSKKRSTFTRKKYTAKHLFYTKSLATRTMVMCVIFFVMSALAYGLIFDMDSLGGNLFLNFFCLAILKFVASLLTIFADFFIKNTGRKTIYYFCMTVLMTGCFTITGLKIFGLGKSRYETVFFMLSIMMTSPLWTDLHLSLTELYPTPIRNTATGFVNTLGRIGSAVAPQILFLSSIWPPLAYLTYGCLGLVAFVLYTIYIPETKGQKLPETMPEKVVASSLRN